MEYPIDWGSDATYGELAPSVHNVLTFMALASFFGLFIISLSSC